MANTLLNPTRYVREAIMAFENALVAAKKVHRGYESEWGTDQNGHYPGQAVTIKEPMYASVTDGLTVSVEDLRERSRTLTLNNGKNSAFTLTTPELTYNISEFRDRIILPAVRRLANQVDEDIFSLYKKIPNQVGTPGTTPSDFSTYADAGVILDNYGVMQEDRCILLNPAAHAATANELKGLFIPGRVDDMVSKGYVTKDLAGFEVYKSNNVKNHTVGTWAGGTVLVDDTVADGDATMNLDQNGAGSALTVKQGDIFTVGSVNAVNPQNKSDLGVSRQFCVDTDATFADAGGGDFNLDITCSPGTASHQMYETTSYQNMSALPANNAAVTVAGTSGLVHPVNLAFQKKALTLVMKPLAKLDSAVWYAEESYKGFTISVMKYLEGSTRKETIRFDILYVADVLQRDGVVRIAG
jgi:hypothetical protein